MVIYLKKIFFQQNLMFYSILFSLDKHYNGWVEPILSDDGFSTKSTRHVKAHNRILINVFVYHFRFGSLFMLFSK